MVHSVICTLVIACCHLSSIKCYQYETLRTCHHLCTQPHTISGPSPVFVLCGCLGEAQGGRPAIRPLHMLPISIFADLLSPLLASSCSPISPLLSVCISLSMSTKLPVRLSISPSVDLPVWVEAVRATFYLRISVHISCYVAARSQTSNACKHVRRRNNSLWSYNVLIQLQ